MRQATPNAVVLTEMGELPLWVRWLKRSARLWNRLLQEPPGSLARRALEASVALAQDAPNRQLAWLPWAGQLAVAMEAVGLPLDLQQPRPVSYAAVQRAGLERHLEQLSAAATRQGATKTAHYVQRVWGGTLDASTYGRAAYVDAVRERARRQALAQLRTGSHWGAEETGRWERTAREQRICPHCRTGVEDVEHMLFVCPLYATVRARFPQLFAEQHSLHSFFGQAPGAVAHFAADSRRTWLAATESQQR